MRQALAVALALFALFALPSPVAAQTDAWQLLRQPGVAAFMRHSDAPGFGGFGDPPGFRLEDCASQRNLSEAGRAQARRTGEAFRRHGVTFDRVLTSPWCRCKETASLAIGAEAEVFEPLSNLVGRGEHRERQVNALRAFLADLDGKTRVLLVTHGIVIHALTGIQPAQGELILLRPGPGGEPGVKGRLRAE
jgi:broad specificity phosphatase PhoE